MVLHGDPCVGRPALVSGPTGPLNRIPPAIAITQSTSSGPLKQGTPISAMRSAPTSRLETIRETHFAEGISEQASELIQSEWSKGTNTASQLGWARWSSWCAKRQINPISGEQLRYSATWEVDVVTKYLSAMGSNESLSQTTQPEDSCTDGLGENK